MRGPKPPRALVVGEPNPTCRTYLQGLDWEWSPKDQVVGRLLEARVSGRPYTALIIEADPRDPSWSEWRASPHRQGLTLVALTPTGLTVDFDGPTSDTVMSALLARPPAENAEGTASLSVLVVDDVPVNQRFLEGHLARLGHRAQSTGSSAAALQALKETAFDLVLMDIELPDRDGLQTTRELRRTQGPNRTTPVVGVSGHSGEVARQRCLESGMQEVLVKPVTRDQLQGFIETWGGRRVLISAPRSSGSVDLRNLLEMTEGNAKVLAEVIGLFADDVSACLARLSDFLKQQDRLGFQSCARTLAGAAATLGARQLEALAAQAAEADWPEEAQHALAQLYTESRRVDAFLKSGLVEPEVVEVEFSAPLQLDLAQAHLVDLHSFLNMFNVIASDLFFLGRDLDLDGPLRPCLNLFEAFASELRDHATLRAGLSRTEAVLEEFWVLFRAATEGQPESRVRDSSDNLARVFAVLRRRVDELRQRLEEPDRWVPHDLGKLRHALQQMFSAVEKNSRGRYQIVFNVAAKEKQDYLIHLDLYSVEGNTLTMPPVLHDVFRDLLANARKYTDPGGTIQGGLVDDGQNLRLVVEDNGRGIPAAEVPRVIEMGFRASNVVDRPTMGGGFGLTKAYWVASRFGGSLTIRSGVQRGTRVEIVIPHAPHLASTEP